MESVPKPTQQISQPKPERSERRDAILEQLKQDLVIVKDIRSTLDRVPANAAPDEVKAAFDGLEARILSRLPPGSAKTYEAYLAAEDRFEAMERKTPDFDESHPADLLEYLDMEASEEESQRQAALDELRHYENLHEVSILKSFRSLREDLIKKNRIVTELAASGKKKIVEAFNSRHTEYLENSPDDDATETGAQNQRPTLKARDVMDIEIDAFSIVLTLKPEAHPATNTKYGTSLGLYFTGTPFCLLKGTS